MKDQSKILEDRALDVLFRDARTYNGFKGDVSDVLVQAVYDLMKWGPTSANCCPARFVFVKSAAAKKKLEPHLDEGNRKKTMEAPLTALIANNLKFYEDLPKLFPHAKDARNWFEGNDAKIKETAMRNGTLQGAYFMLAARALGLDCGPMSGFNQGGVKDAFFAGQDVQVNFICNIGYGDPASLYPRGPRLGFDEACKIL